MKKNPQFLVTFYYKGITQLGQVMQGELQASSKIAALMELRRQGIATRSLRKKYQFFTRKKIRPTEISLFARQLATLVNAGIPLLQCFDIIAQGQKNQTMQNLIDEIKRTVNLGVPLAESFRRHSKYFNELFCSLVHIGEQSGNLDLMLTKIAIYKEKIESLKNKIKKALSYPFAVLIIALVVTVAMLMFIVPQFESLFIGFGATLPTFTLCVVNFSRFLKTYWLTILIAICISSFLIINFIKNSPMLLKLLENGLLKIPIIAPLLKKTAHARFSRTLSITLAAGLPLLDALVLVANTAGFLIFKEAILTMRQTILNGQHISVAMQQTQLFPHKIIQMIAVGEESGTLDNMLSKIADFYEEEIDNSIELFNSLIEPLIMALLGLLVGGLVVAMYLPIFKLGSIV